MAESERKAGGSKTSYTVHATTSQPFSLVTNRTNSYLQKTLPPQPFLDQSPITYTLTPKPAGALHRVNSPCTYRSVRLFSYRVQYRGKRTTIYHLASADPCTVLEATVQSPNPCRPPRQCLARFFPTLVWFYTGRDELPDELFGKPLLHFSTASTILHQSPDPKFLF